MKNLSYIISMVTLVLGLQISSNAHSMLETVDGPSTTIPTGNAGAEYFSVDQAIVVSMATAGDRERVLVTVENSRGQVVAQEYIIVDGKGAQTRFEMRGQPEGFYVVTVTSNTIQYVAKLQIG